jgi:hypothetical protein
VTKYQFRKLMKECQPNAWTVCKGIWLFVLTATAAFLVALVPLTLIGMAIGTRYIREADVPRHRDQAPEIDVRPFSPTNR